MTVVGGVINAVGTFFKMIYDYAALGVAFWLGGERARGKALKRGVEVKDDQLKITSRPAMHVDELRRLMRERKRR